MSLLGFGTPVKYINPKEIRKTTWKNDQEQDL